MPPRLSIAFLRNDNNLGCFRLSSFCDTRLSKRPVFFQFFTMEQFLHIHAFRIMLLGLMERNSQTGNIEIDLDGMSCFHQSRVALKKCYDPSHHNSNRTLGKMAASSSRNRFSSKSKQGWPLPDVFVHSLLFKLEKRDRLGLKPSI